MSTKAKRLLILSAGFGDGHNAAAAALAEAFRAGGHRVRVADLFAHAHPTLNELVRKAYRFAITNTPKIWQKIYQASDAADFSPRRFDVFSWSARALKEILEEFEPDAVISTYPLYAHLVERLVGSHGHLPYPFVSVVTDAQTINSIWYCNRSDHYSVIDQTSADVLRAAGIPERKIHVFGFPIRLSFDAPPVFFPDSPLRILFLPSTKKREVAMILRRLIHSDYLPARKISVVSGRHYERLKGIIDRAGKSAPPGVTVESIGWTDRIPLLLQTHHCVIGKAGGASVQEAMAARCPLLINYVVPGQEEGNAASAVGAGCAKIIASPASIDGALAALLEDDRRGLKAMRAAAESAGKPAAAKHIAEFVLDLIHP